MPSPEDAAFSPAPPPSTKPAPKRGFLSSQVRATLATAAVVALLGLASVPWLLSSPARMSRLMARAMPRLEADVRFGGVRLGWLGPIVLEDIHVVPRDGTRSPISITRIELSHGLAGILLSLGDLGRIRAEGLEAHVVYDADRNSNIKTLFRPAEEVAANQTGTPRAPRRSPIRLKLDVVGATVRIDGPWSAEQWVSDPIDVRAALAPAPNGQWSEWTVDPVQLLADARLEPAVAQGVLSYIAPVMADATRTGGRFSLRLDGGTFPVGAPEAARLSGTLSMHAVDLGPGPLVMNIIRALPFQLPAPPAIRIADQSHVEFRLAERRVWHKGLEFGVPLAKPGQRLDLQSSGSVGLDDKMLDLKLELPIPADLPQDRPLLASLAGRTFSVRIGGMLGEPKVNFDGSLRATAGDVVTELVGRLRGAQPPQRPNQENGTPLPPPTVEPGWKPNAPAAGAAASGEKSQQPGAVPAAGAIRSALPANADDSNANNTNANDAKKDATAEAVIDLVGGVLGEVAKRRAERQAAEAANPQQPPPRRGRLLRRLIQPPAATPAPPLTPVPRPSSPQPEPAPTPAQ